MAYRNPQLPPKPQFFQNILALPPKPKRVPSRRPKFKSKGGGGKYQYSVLDEDFSSKARDAMRVALEGGVGDSPSRQQQFFDLYLKYLTKKELNALLRKIHLLALSLLGLSQENEEFFEGETLIRSLITKHLKGSDKNQSILKEEILEKLDAMQDLEVSYDNQGERTILFERQIYPFSQFLLQHFSEFIDAFEKGCQEGTIIRDTRRHTGKMVVKKIVWNHLKNQNS